MCFWRICKNGKDSLMYPYPTLECGYCNIKILFWKICYILFYVNCIWFHTLNGINYMNSNITLVDRFLASLWLPLLNSASPMILLCQDANTKTSFPYLIILYVHCITSIYFILKQVEIVNIVHFTLK